MTATAAHCEPGAHGSHHIEAGVAAAGGRAVAAHHTECLPMAVLAAGLPAANRRLTAKLLPGGDNLPASGRLQVFWGGVRCEVAARVALLLCNATAGSRDRP